MVASGQERTRCGVGGIWVQSNPFRSEHHILMPLFSFGRGDATQDLAGSSSKAVFPKHFPNKSSTQSSTTLERKLLFYFSSVGIILQSISSFHFFFFLIDACSDNSHANALNSSKMPLPEAFCGVST